MSVNATLPEAQSSRTRFGFLVVAMLTALVSTGCTRSYWRRQADVEAFNLVREKAFHPHWDLPNYSIAIDPSSRMFDPFNPDHPPLPPDDPWAHDYMHRVDGRNGFPRWHIDGDTPYAENPAWAAYMPTNADGIVQLDKDETVRQAYLHSREYQLEEETVFLSALDVAFERFRFDSQLFAGAQTNYTADGPLRPGSGGQARSTFLVGTFPATRGIQSTKLFTTGANLVVGIANSLTWQLAGPDDYRGTTLVDFNLIQPLLLNAGRARIMERLTLAERLLLYNVRAMQRYRQQFTVSVLTGRNAGGGPSRSGGVFGGAGLEGFTGVGGTGFGQITGVTGAVQGAGGGGQGAGAQAAGGYIGLLQSQQVIRNQEDNVQRLRDNLNQLETRLQELLTTRASSDVILRQRLQVAQARQALINSNSRLLNSRNDFETTLDNFKITLGLPPQLCIQIRDNFLDQFQLLDLDTNSRQNDVSTSIDRIADANQRVVDLVTEDVDENTKLPVRRLAWGNDIQSALEQLLNETESIESLRKRIVSTNLPQAIRDVTKFSGRMNARREQLTELKRRFDAERGDLCRLLPVPSIERALFDTERLPRLLQSLKGESTRLTKRFDEFGERFEKLQKDIKETISEGPNLSSEERFLKVRDDVLLASQNLLTEMRVDLLSLQLLQSRARSETVQLVDVSLRAPTAIEVARRYRHDWMNARGQLVDSWRRIRFNANQLMSQLDIVFSGDITNRGDNPLSLRGNTGRLRAGLQFNSPLTKASERNVYRQTLLEYQQARRSYYAFEDGVARSLRQQLRTMQVNQINFELQRSAFIQAAEQIAINDDIRQNQEITGAAVGATAARDAVSALSDLLDAQNNFLSVWVNAEVLRMQIDNDLGTMRIAPDGTWLDPGALSEEGAARLLSADPNVFNYTDQDVREAVDFMPPDSQIPGSGETLPIPQGTQNNLDPLPAPNSLPPNTLPANPLPQGTSFRGTQRQNRGFRIYGDAVQGDQGRFGGEPSTYRSSTNDRFRFEEPTSKSSPSDAGVRQVSAQDSIRDLRLPPPTR